MRIVDAHHHLWDLQAHHYPWLATAIDHPVGDYAAIRRSYRIADLLADAAGLDLVKSVHVQAEIDDGDPVAETVWLQAQTDAEHHRGLPSAIVAYADLLAPDVESVLERHSACRNLRGIRYMLNWDAAASRFRFAPHGGLMSDPTWRRGFALLRRFDLSFDLQIWWQQMDEACNLAASFADVPLILNHAGMPRRRDADYLDGWRAAMRRLAACPNVACKISGLGMFDRTWTTASIRPLVLHAIDCFGAARCMFASNFPVDKLMSDYAAIWNAFDEITKGFSDEERNAMFAGNAERYYRI